MAETANSIAGIAGQHWVRYGTAADQCYLLDKFKETYDQIVINGNMVAHMASALSQFITQRAQKPFVIDPQTHAFAHDLDHLRSRSKSSEGEIKRSWKKLIDQYGDPLSSVLIKEKRPLDPSDFSSDSDRKIFTEKVLLFQKDAITREIEEGEDREYLEFLEEEMGVSALVYPPQLLIAPYFFIDGPLASQWLDKNLEFLKNSRVILTEQNVDIPLAAQIVISQEILSNKTRRDEIIERYTEQKPDVILLWIDQFSEHKASESELQNYIELLKGFGNESIPTVNLYGSFFSVALMRFSETLNGALSAVCHGLEYGETRSVIPLGCEIPVAKFYSRKLHHRLPPRVAYREMSESEGLDSGDDFHEKICGCPSCKDVIVGDPKTDLIAYFETKESSFWRARRRISMSFPTGTASENCTKHYMWCKAWEYHELNITIEDLNKQLSKVDARLRKPLGVEYAGHRLVWSNVLEITEL